MNKTMRYLAWALVPPLIGMAVYAVRSADWSRHWAVFAKSAPVLECPGRLELGEHELGKVAVARFTVANRGGGELVIHEIHTNCACSGLEQEKDGQFTRVDSLRLGPNEEADLAVRLLVQGSHGNPVRNSVTFRTNDVTRPQAVVEMHVSKVRAGVTTVPIMVAFGSTPVGSEARQILDVFDGAVQPRTIDRVVSSCPERVAIRLLPLDGTLSEAKNANTPGVLIGRLEVMARAQEPGSLDVQLAIHLAGEGHPPSLVRVNGRVAALIEILPSLLVLPQASEAGPRYFGKCLCRSTEGKPLVLTVDSAPDEVSVQMEAVEGAPSQQIVRIEWHPARGGKLNQATPRKVRLRARVGGQDVPLEILVTCLREGGQ